MHDISIVLLTKTYLSIVIDEAYAGMKDGQSNDAS